MQRLKSRFFKKLMVLILVIQPFLASIGAVEQVSAGGALYPDKINYPSTVSGVAYHDGYIYTSIYNNQTSTITKQRASDPNDRSDIVTFSNNVKPLSIDFDSQGNLYFIVNSLPHIYKISKPALEAGPIAISGFNDIPSKSEIVFTGDQTYMTGMTIDENDNFYYSNSNRPSNNPNGLFKIAAGSWQATPLASNFATYFEDLSVSPQGNLYMVGANNKLYKMDLKADMPEVTEVIGTHFNSYLNEESIPDSGSETLIDLYGIQFLPDSGEVYLSFDIYRYTMDPFMPGIPISSETQFYLKKFTFEDEAAPPAPQEPAEFQNSVQLENPRGLAYYNNEVYVAQFLTDGGTKARISKISKSGAVTPLVVFDYSANVKSVALNSSGDLYFTLEANAKDNNIYKIPADRLPLSGPIGSGQVAAKAEVFYTPTNEPSWVMGLAFDSEDNLYFSTFTTKGIYKIAKGENTATEVLTNFSSAISSLAFHPNGDLYFVDGVRRVYKLDHAKLSNLPVLTSNIEQFSKFNNLQVAGIAFLREGDKAYVAHGFWANAKLEKLDFAQDPPVVADPLEKVNDAKTAESVEEMLAALSNPELGLSLPAGFESWNNDLKESVAETFIYMVSENEKYDNVGQLQFLLDFAVQPFFTLNDRELHVINSNLTSFFAKFTQFKTVFSGYEGMTELSPIGEAYLTMSEVDKEIFAYRTKFYFTRDETPISQSRESLTATFSEYRPINKVTKKTDMYNALVRLRLLQTESEAYNAEQIGSSNPEEMMDIFQLNLDKVDGPGFSFQRYQELAQWMLDKRPVGGYTDYAAIQETFDLFFAPRAPSVTADDDNNRLVGADATMEYSRDGGIQWLDYDSIIAPTFAGDVTVQIRVKAAGNMQAGAVTTVTFTANPVQPAPSAPSVSVNEATYMINGADSTMEYSLDGGILWISYNPDEAPVFRGNYTVQIRVKASGEVPAGLVTVLYFRETQVEPIPGAPSVTANDEANLLVGADGTMEYSTDNGSLWNGYDPGNPPVFAGNVTVQIRVKAEGDIPAGELTTVTFTQNITVNPPSGGSDSGSGNNSGSGSVGASPTAPTSNKEEIVVDVDGANGTNLAKTPITRTTEANGTVKDHVSMSENIAKETAQKAKQLGIDTARIVIPDTNDKVSEIVVEVPKSALKQLNDGNLNLEIATDNGIISIPAKSIADFNDDLYFRIIPIKSETGRKQVEERAKQEELIQEIVDNGEVRILGRPMEIETNMQSREVSIVLPLKDSLPADSAERQKVLDNLGVFIEHSDGTKELLQGKLVTLKDGSESIEFTITKFSTFTLVYMDGWKAAHVSHHTAYIKGFGTEFRPGAFVTRAQMAAMLARNAADQEPSADQSPYEDVGAAHWAYHEILKTKALGMMTGTKTDSFDPDGSVTRAQMATIAYRWIQQECTKDVSAFEGCSTLSGQSSAGYKDVSSAHWAAEAISFMSSTGLMVGYEDNTFRPDGKLTRAEAVGA
ncbi:S-layer family protein [Fontibacillus phaseoli]|uniref:S-layer family protein n=1 Tax=Fontibacillus phaseoli TaxID=1416533 RepID=A0A369BGR3_9BACL|nr:DUF4073 domain-containing protein [Fontibacillus phaseoli]RCX20601.1 S-layer family protein [Fontibacillus phaseoli]